MFMEEISPNFFSNFFVFSYEIHLLNIFWLLILLKKLFNSKINIKRNLRLEKKKKIPEKI